MRLDMTPDLEETVQAILQGGRYDGESAVLREALSLLQKSDQMRRDIQAGIAELDRGEGISGQEVFRELGEKAARFIEGNT